LAISRLAEIVGQNGKARIEVRNLRFGAQAGG